MSNGSTSRNDQESRFTEGGIQVYQVSDYEWVAAATEDEAVAFILKEWGYKDVPTAEHDGCFDRKDVSACDLDKNKVNIHPDAEDGKVDFVTYRESVKRLLAAGEPMPIFFAGIDA